MPIWGWIAPGVAAGVLGYALWTYNRLVGLGKRAEAAWSDIDVQLKRRWDLVPALVATVEGYARHEAEALRGAVEARNRAARAATIGGRGESERGLASAVGGVFALAEAYPGLKADRNFLDLHRDLVEIEDTVQYARRYYNAVVRDHNTLARSFPALLVAHAAGLAERPFFQLDDDSQRAAPGVSL